MTKLTEKVANIKRNISPKEKENKLILVNLIPYKLDLYILKKFRSLIKRIIHLFLTK